MFLIHQIKDMGVVLKDAEKGLMRLPVSCGRGGSFICAGSSARNRLNTGTTSKRDLRGREPLDDTDNG